MFAGASTESARWLGAPIDRGRDQKAHYNKYGRARSTHP
jgi:hypothetical protein